MRYLALLRGVNVGGNNTVPMAQLASVFTALGFSEVKTYINSGNVIFSSAKEPERANIEQALRDEFGFEISLLILSQMEFTSVAMSIPDEMTNDLSQKTDVAFLFPEVDNADILQQVGYQPDIEKMIYCPKALIVNIDRKNQTKGSMMKLIGTPLYRQMTIRNVNTVCKLAGLMA